MEISSEEMFRKLRLVVRINEHEVPRNVALLFFNDDPEKFFRGARIDVVQFGDDAGGDLTRIIHKKRQCINQHIVLYCS
jgi:ATP-dependent DNA helicase RecG